MGDRSTAIKLGTKGEDVVRLEHLLAAAGLWGSPTGLFSEDLRAAVQKFQASVGLKPTGRVTAATWDALEAATNGAGPKPGGDKPRPGGSGKDEGTPDAPVLDKAVADQRHGGTDDPAVIRLELMLEKAGFGPTGRGIFDAELESTVRDFQAAAGLEATGVVSGPTWEALLKAGSGPTAAREGDVAPGDIGQSVAELRDALAATGADIAPGDAFDTRMERAVVAFQVSAGLPATGRVDGRTAAQLAKPARAEEVELDAEVAKMLGTEDLQRALEERDAIEPLASYTGLASKLAGLPVTLDMKREFPDLVALDAGTAPTAEAAIPSPVVQEAARAAIATERQAPVRPGAWPDFVLRADVIQTIRDHVLDANAIGGVMDRRYRLSRTGIALSGGGARGDFEVGALAFLYEWIFGERTDGLQRRPDIVAGTSVGAINAVKLADGYDASFEELEQLWNTRRYNSDMYVSNINWDRMLGEIQGAGEGAVGSIVVGGILGGGLLFNPAFLATSLLAVTHAASEAGRILRRHLGEARAIFNLAPIDQLIRRDFEPYWTAAGPGLRGAGIAVSRDAGGRAVVIARGYDDSLNVSVELQPGGAWSPWTVLARERVVIRPDDFGLERRVREGDRIDTDPVVLEANGVLVGVVARLARDGRYHELSFTGTDAARRDHWASQWVPHGWPSPLVANARTYGGQTHAFTSHPTARSDAAVFAGARTQVVIGRGADEQVWLQFLHNGRWYTHLVGFPSFRFASRVSIAATGNGGLFAFARTRTGAIARYGPMHNGLAGNWREFPGARATGDLAVALNPDANLIDVFCRGLEGGVYVLRQATPDTDAWQDDGARWLPLGGFMTSTPQVAMGADRRLRLFGRGLDGGIWTKSQRAPSGAWPGIEVGWERIAPPPDLTIEGEPVLARSASGALTITAVASDQAVWRMTQGESGRWDRDWVSLGGCVWTGVRVRLATVNLERGELQHVDERGVLVESQVPGTLRDGVIASSSIPAVFPAVPIGGATWVDGGVRSITPIQAAIDAGAEEVFAIVSMSPTPAAPVRDLAGVHGLGATVVTNWATASLVPVALRGVTEVMVGSIMQNELHPRRGWPVPVHVIQPSVDIHSAMTINPGLIRISMAYGYMRGWDVLFADDVAAAMANSDAIAWTRRRIWQLEEFLAVLVRLARDQPADSIDTFGSQWLRSTDLHTLVEDILHGTQMIQPTDMERLFAAARDDITGHARDGGVPAAVGIRDLVVPRIRELRTQLAPLIRERLELRSTHRRRDWQREDEMLPRGSDRWVGASEAHNVPMPASPFGAFTIVPFGDRDRPIQIPARPVPTG